MDKKRVFLAIRNLVDYGLMNHMLQKEDQVYTINQLLEVMQMDDYKEPEATESHMELEEILTILLDYAVEQKLIEDSIVHRDLFDTKLMNVLMPKPSEVIHNFKELYKKSPKEATDYYYKLSKDSDYIRRYRVCKDEKWVVDTAYGELDITINLSKPEKDPKAIAAAKLAKQSSYPLCLLCAENEGFAGRINHPARQNHRIIPLSLGGEDWCMQYSPYVYYNEHCIIFDRHHVPMAITRETFEKELEFIEQFPHYMVGSNADLPIVGGSILTHNHFQGGNYEFAMAKAKILEQVVIPGFEDCKAGMVEWPMSVVRISAENKDRLVELADHILKSWRAYTDEEAFIFANTNGEAHNTITPIARKRGNEFELDLVLRNNITTEEHPLGVYHPHEELHHIKKENIGLIEVMGLAILPSRLKEELSILGEYMVEGKDITKNEMIEKHAAWAKEIIHKYDNISTDNVKEILHKEVGIVFLQVLEHAGVYKQDAFGREHFMKFMNSL
ncbi:MAG: UDP-glucose--hexose-1-phosphate uridylyltransferase [bacterium]|nr:UDP-glucose--hexose-1-phosphate uridylyltransferase [bacterium]